MSALPRVALPQNPRDRRIAALAILLLLVALVAAAITVPVVLLHRHYDDNLARMTRQWRSQTAFNALRPQVVKALDVLKAKDVKRYFLKGTTSALATAELQDQVRQVVEASGGRLNPVSANPSRDEGAYRFSGANFQVNISSVNLRRLLHGLETREPYLFVDNLTVRSQTPPGFRAPAGTTEPELFVQMDVSAISQLPAESAAAPAKPAAGSKP